MSEPKKIRVSLETRKTLKTMKRGGESYDAMIRRLIHVYRCAELDEPGDFKVWLREYLEEVGA